MRLEDRIDRRVILYGLAENAMSGAIVICGQNSHVYVGGLEAWAADQRMKAVQVKGTLRVRGDDADAEPDEFGLETHTLGRHYVVEDAVWRIIP